MKKSGITYWLAKTGMILMLPIFMVVMWTEKLIARIFHLTYNEVNILVYYLLIPLSWAAIIDYKVGFPVISILFLLLWSYLYWKVRRDFRHYCDVVFRLSQAFLLRFKNIGWNYVVSSVIICVIVPIIIYIGLFYMLFTA